MLVKNLKNALNSRNITRINEAFNQFYNHYFKLIYYIISQYIDNTCDVEDLTQDVFVKFFNNITKIDLDNNVKYYLTTIAKNTALNFLKYQNKNIIIKDDLILSIIDNNSTTDKYIYKNLLEDMSKYLDELEVKIIIYHCLEGMKFKDISKILNKSTNTVITIYHRAIKKYKKKVGNIYHD